MRDDRAQTLLAVTGQREGALQALQKTARAEQKREQTEALIRNLPARHNLQRLCYLAHLTAVDRRLLERSGTITAAENVEATQAKQDGLLTSYVASRLGVRANDVDRWDQDGRLPHAWTKTVRIQGRATVVRVWLAADVDAAREA